MSDPDESQNFVWYITEDNVQNNDVLSILEFLSNKELIEIDKIIKPINEIKIDFLRKVN